MSINKPTSGGGSNNETHDLIELREPPASLTALRIELQYHPDVVERAMKGETFDQCLGLIGVSLDIALDGIYDCDALCKLFVEALRNRRFFPNEPHKLARGLVDVELIEKEGTVELVERDRNVALAITSDTIVTETTTASLANQAGTGDAATPGREAGTREAEGASVGTGTADEESS